MSRINFRKLKTDRRKKQAEQMHNIVYAVYTLKPIIDALRTMSEVITLLKDITETSK